MTTGDQQISRQNQMADYPPDRTVQTGQATGQQLGADLEVGQIVGGDYLVLAWIGSGGMGNVYRVRHQIMQREYALKTLAAEKINETAWRRFQNEAQAIARLNHPNIVGIYNLGLHDGTLPYYVMDLLQGQTLQEMIRQSGPLETEPALKIFQEVCAGIGYAHKKGIIHRDIKPANIIVLEEEQGGSRVKIVDFGIAKLTGGHHESVQKLTTAGEIFGSPSYMSPEQCQGGKIDARSDIYSLGCTLFEVLTGTPPFKGNSVVETLLQHQNAERPTLKNASRGKEFPAVLEQMVATMLARAPINRYQSMERVGEDLAAIAAGKNAAISPYRPASQAANQWQNTANNEQPNVGQLSAASQPRANFSQFKAIVTAAAVLIAIVSSVIWWLFERPRKAEVTNPLPGKQAASAVREQFPAPKAIAYATTSSGESGRKVISFHFPDHVSLGEIRVDSPSAGAAKISCRGEQKIEGDHQLYFFPATICVAQPLYFDNFLGAPLYSITLPATPPALKSVTPLAIVHIKRLRALRRLDLRYSPGATAEILPYLDQFPNLETLLISPETMTAGSLARAHVIKTLHALNYGFADSQAIIPVTIDPLLEALQKSSFLEVLELPGITLMPQDLNLIAKMKYLRRVDFSDSNMDWMEIKILSELPKLEEFKAERCKIDGMAIPAFQVLASHSLRKIDIRSPLFTPELLRRYRQALPQVVIQ
jgi:serine/threonine protein kinase